MITAAANTRTMTYQPMSYAWIGAPSVIGFLISLDPNWGALIGPAISVAGSLGAVLVKYLLDKRRQRYLEKIRELERKLDRLEGRIAVQEEK